MSVFLFFLVIPSIVAFVFGLIALSRIKKHGPRRGRGLAIAGVVIGILVALGGIAADFAIGYFATHTTSYSDLRAGDCVKRPNGEVSLLRHQSCSADHDRQVFATFDVNQASSSYPGRTELRGLAEGECVSRFNAVAADAPNRSELGVFFLVPNQTSWEDSDNRRVVCLVGNRNGSPLTAPLPFAER